MMRLRDFSCGLFFMLQVSGTIVMYIKGRKHKLQRSAFYFMFYLPPDKRIRVLRLLH